MQQVLTSLAPSHVSGIFSEIVASTNILAVDQFGLGVVKKAIALAEACGFSSALGSRLDASLFQLVEDAYGNYAVQHAVEHWSVSVGAQASKRMANRLTDRIISLASHKFASNVAEAIIRVGDPQLRLKVMKTLVHSQETIEVLMRSPFPVFVVSTALRYCPSPQLAQTLIDLISACLANDRQEIKNRPKWEKLVQTSTKWEPPCCDEKQR
jgi:hypothetical protein